MKKRIEFNINFSIDGEYMKINVIAFFDEDIPSSGGPDPWNIDIDEVTDEHGVSLMDDLSSDEFDLIKELAFVKM